MRVKQWLYPIVTLCSFVQSACPKWLTLTSKTKKTSFLGFVSSASLLLATAAPDTPSISPVIDSFQYANSAAASAFWQPMAGTPAAEVRPADGTPVARFICPFDTAAVERASWDRKVQLDLSTCRGFEFQLYCQNPTPVSYFTIYFQSGDGWYDLPFFPETSGWNTITLDKAKAETEGKPAGWHTIQTIRISAWRGSKRATEFWVRDLRMTGVLGVDTLAVLIRGDSKSQTKEYANHREYVYTIAKHLEALGIGFTVLSDTNLNYQTLRLANLAILPDNASLPAPALETMTRYLQGGGRILAFYGLPEKLRPLAKIDSAGYVKPARTNEFAAMKFTSGLVAGAPTLVRQHSWNIVEPKPVPGASRALAQWVDEAGQPAGHAAIVGSTNAIEVSHVLLKEDPENQRQLLLALTCQLVPELGRQAVDTILARTGRLAGCHDLKESSAVIEQSGNSQAKAMLADVRELSKTAVARRDAGQYVAACELATQASQRMLEAFATAQKPLPGEFRAFWCHSAFGVKGMSWDAAIQRLAENGLNAILPNMLWGGLAYYPSSVLPVASEVAVQGDQIAQCLAACRKYGVKMYVWKVNWNSSHAPKEFLDRMRAEGRLQRDSHGKEEPWLCPSHLDNQRMEIDSMVEIVKRYDVDGIHFDYIRYPDADHCYCDGCRERFVKATGATITQWPADVLKGGPHLQAWLDWRRSNITRVVKTVSEQAHALKPKIQVSAAVFPNWAIDRDNIGQDWSLWCQQGYLDFVCPMDYTASDAQLDNWVKQQKAWAGPVPYYPGIGAWVLTPDRVIGQIQITRKHDTKGFVIFNYDPPTANELAPLLGKGITKKQP
jgi:uncharacterized lipoprotein YddW (UPF0748 family)